MYVARFCKNLWSWVCHNNVTNEVHSTWEKREDAALVARDLNKWYARITDLNRRLDKLGKL